MASDDPLFLLQNAIKSNVPISYCTSSGEEVATLHEATHLRLSPTLYLPKTTPTRFRKPSTTATDPKTSSNDFVNLDALLVAWVGKDASVAEYMKLVRELGGAHFVSITERKGVVDYLGGAESEHERIVPLTSNFPLILQSSLSDMSMLS